jgi:hypothetical protein
MNHKLQREQKNAAFQAALQQPAGTPGVAPETQPMPGFDLQSLLQGQLHVPGVGQDHNRGWANIRERRPPTPAQLSPPH